MKPVSPKAGVDSAAGDAAKVSRWATSDGTGDRSGAWAITGTLGRLVHRIGTGAILLSFPIIAVYLWHVNEHCDGSATQFVQGIATGGLHYLGASYPRSSWVGVRYILGFGAVQAALQLLVPGKQFRGPSTPKGNVPVYTANGVQCYLATLALFFAAWRLQLFDPATVYDHLGAIVSTSNILSLLLCGLLYLKGRFAPSSSDSGTTGSLLFDYYWGMELYPRLGPFDIKTWTNCRVGMMSWSVLTLCYAAKQAALLGAAPSPSMLASVALLQLYVFKFFLWETGYWASMDIAHDRAGFYLCWGCLVWIPSVYTSPAMYLVRRPGVLSPAAAAFVFAFGAAMIAINYDSDRQRQEFRRSKGKGLVWGQKPVTIRARYTTADGAVKESLLLASGWWALARHFHYLPEVFAAFAWSCPGGLSSPVPYVYLIFLTSLLADRAYRDDERCRAKYGKYWEQYCKLVPYRVIPGIF